MDSTTSPRFISKLADLRVGDHVCFLYEADDELAHVLTRFLVHGLDRREKVIYLTTAGIDRAVEILKAGGLTAQGYQASGQLEIREAMQFYAPEESFQPETALSALRSQVEHLSDEGFSALRVASDMDWMLRGVQGAERSVAYEARLNNLLQRNDCLAMDIYDRRQFSPSRLLEAMATHPLVIVGLDLYDNSYYVPDTAATGEEAATAHLRHWLADLRERKHIREVLYQENQFISAILDALDALVIVIDTDGRIVRFNRACEQVTGYTFEEVRGRAVWDLLLLPVEVPAVKQVFENTRKSGAGRYENFWLTHNGEPRLIAWSNTAIHNPDGTVKYVIGTGLDITEQRRDQERVSRLNRLCSAIGRINEAIIRAERLQEVFDAACRIAVAEGGMRMAWIGLTDESSQLVKPVAQDGYVEGYLDQIIVSTQDIPEGRGPGGLAVREQRIVVCDDLLVDESMRPWRSEAARRGYRAVAVSPLRREQQVVGLLALYADEPAFFQEEELRLLEALAADLSVAISSDRIAKNGLLA